MAFGYPVMLELRGRRCVVVGGGTVAEAKVRGLVEAGAEVALIAPELTEELESLAGRRLIAVLRRPYMEGDLDGAFLAIAATDDAGTNAKIFAEAEARGVLLNAVDDIAHCHFAAPAVLRRGDLVVALSTGGKAPALAKQLRSRLSWQFPEEYSTLLELLGEVREEALRVRKVEFSEWARRWERAMRRDLIGLVRQGRSHEAKQLLWDDLNHPDQSRSTGFVWIVGAGPGDPDLITVKGAEALSRADVVVYDRLASPALVAGKEAIYAGKSPGLHSAPQAEINELLIRLAGKGKTVVRLKGGDPFVFGRGGEEAEALNAAGIPYEVVPAPSSAVAAPATAGIPVTDRRVSSSVTIATGHCGGQDTVDWKAIARASDTIVILMGMINLEHITSQLLEGGLSPRTPAAIVENGTLPSQRVLVGELASLPSQAAAQCYGSPAVIVVGEVVRLRERLVAIAEAVAP
jgi:uroporphyrin-III C-methyltransferase / precorrin-2 dehydrogenase / sirohydrochlorin ferrochelatase